MSFIFTVADIPGDLGYIVTAANCNLFKISPPRAAYSHYASEVNDNRRHSITGKNITQSIKLLRLSGSGLGLINFKQGVKRSGTMVITVLHRL